MFDSRWYCAWKDYGYSWDVRVPTARKIVKTKQKLAIIARERWSLYASLEEDEYLRSKKWNKLVGVQNYRLIMHDNTNAGVLPTPSDPEINMSTFSKYYNGNVSKSGVAAQLCGW